MGIRCACSIFYLVFIFIFFLDILPTRNTAAKGEKKKKKASMSRNAAEVGSSLYFETQPPAIMSGD